MLPPTPTKSVGVGEVPVSRFVVVDGEVDERSVSCSRYGTASSIFLVATAPRTSTRPSVSLSIAFIYRAALRHD